MASPEPAFAKRLTWTEPRGFRKAELKGSWKSVMGIIGLTVGAALVFVGIANRLGAGADVAWKLWVGAGGIIVVCVVVWVGTRLMRITVAITDKTIVWEMGDTPTVYRFGAIDHCEISTASVGGRTISVLVVVLKNGDREPFGVALAVSPEVLRTTLEQRGINVMTKTDVMSEQALTTEENELSPSTNAGSTVRPQYTDTSPFPILIDYLQQDGLADEAARLDGILRHTACTTGTELLGLLGLELKRMRKTVRHHASAETKTTFRSATKTVRKVWPRMFWF